MTVRSLPVLLVAALVLVAGVLLWLFVRGDTASSCAATVVREGEAAEVVESANEPIAAARTERSEPAAVAPETLDTRTAPLESAPGDGLATLVVWTVSARDGAPVEGVAVFARPSDELETTVRPSGSAHAKHGEIARSGADGRCELTIASGAEHHVHSSFGGGLLEVARVAALAAGATREVTVEVPFDAAATFFGRVVDAASGAALVDATVTDANATYQVDRDGRFTLPVPDASAPAQRFGRVDAAGYGEKRFLIGTGHPALARELEVHLDKAASLQVGVVDAAATPVAGVRVVLSTKAFYLREQETLLDVAFDRSPVSWRGETDANGSAAFNALPPSVPLELRLGREGDEPRLVHSDLSLAAGEQRTLELNVDSGALVRGRLVDRAGVPIAGHQIWRLPSRVPLPVLLRSGDRRAAVATATTDDSGRFEFSGIPPGSWSIGPAADDHARGEEAIAPLAQLVEVDASSGVVDLELVVDRGLTISGRVLDPEGATLERVYVSVASFGANVFAYTSGVSNESGVFEVGPLPAGRYRLVAGGPASEFAKSEPVEVDAGASGVELRMRRGGTLRGSVVDGVSGERCEAELRWSESDSETIGSTLRPTDGEFELKGLAPGAYTLGARTRDGLFGHLAGVVVRAGETYEGLCIVVRPCATLVITNASASQKVAVTVLLDGLMVASEAIDPGGVERVAAPPGELQLSLRELPQGKSSKKTLHLRDGDTLDVSVGGP